MITRADVERDLVIVACAISAGIHAALTPEHFAESTAAGAGFAVSVIVLAALVAALTRRPSVLALECAAAVLVGLLASYALAVTTGFPALHPDPEPVDNLALFTKAIEIVGVLAATHLVVQARDAVPSTFSRPKGTPA